MAQFNIDNLRLLTELDLSKNRLSKLPDEIGNLTLLKKLVLESNKLRTVPSKIGNLTQLTHLNLTDNRRLTVLPNQIGNLLQLTELYLSCNALLSLPTEIGNLMNLTELHLSFNKLRELPREIGNLTQITYLDLGFNELVILPAEIGNLRQITYMDLSGNQLTELPREIGNLTGLTYLDIHMNNLIVLPLEIVNLTELTMFYYHRNAIENLLHPIINRFIDRFINLVVGRDGNIYNDDQNIHAASIQKSIKDSIFNLMKNYNDEYELNYLANDVLTQKTKEALAEYCDNKDVHSILNITFEELLKSVFIEIESFDEENQKNILEILNQEMEDSICKCFTGRISRLINCLSGFSDKVSIKISTNEEISNIIVVLRNKIDNIDELKRAISVEMTERGYDEATINEWLLFVE